MLQERNHWRMADIASALECSRITVKRLVAFWTQQGILIEGGAGPDGVVVVGSDADVGTFEPAPRSQSFLAEEMEGDDDDDGEGGSRPNQLQETRYQTFSSFLQGLLTNLGESPLDKIYSVLKMFAASSWVDFTIQDCKQFMDSKVKSGDVIYSSGLYSLPSK